MGTRGGGSPRQVRRRARGPRGLQGRLAKRVLLDQQEILVLLANKDQQVQLEKLERLGRQVRLVLLDPRETPARRAILERQAQQVRQEKLALLDLLDRQV